MYAAHAEQIRNETSRKNLDNCLALLKEGRSDNDRFAALLKVSNLVRSNSLTADDRRTILEAVGLKFLARLVKSQPLPPCCSPNLYKSAALSILSSCTADPYFAHHPDISEFLNVINDVISPDSPYNRDSNHDSRLSYEMMCRDCEEIMSNMSKHELGVHHLLQSQTLDLMFKYATSPACQNVSLVLTSLGTVIQTRGDSALNLDPDTFYAVMKRAVGHLGQQTNIGEMVTFARILTSFLTGVSMIAVTVQMDWVVTLAHILKRLVAAKIAPDDAQAVLDLVCALVSTAGPQIMSSEIAGDDNFLKSVVARVSVDVYILLDNITVNNALDRYSHLDSVYKLLTSIVQFVAESGEKLASNSIIVVYRKLVETSEVITEFLYSVANHEIEFYMTEVGTLYNRRAVFFLVREWCLLGMHCQQRNHIVVLLSVRTLAAMLSEITEEATTRLLELLPFFNLLCQNVEYSDDVIMEVKNAAQAALTNIKSIDSSQSPDSATVTDPGPADSPCSGHSLDHRRTIRSSCTFSEIPENIDQTADTEFEIPDELQKVVHAFGSLKMDSVHPEETVSSLDAAKSELFVGSTVPESYIRVDVGGADSTETMSSSLTRTSNSNNENNSCLPEEAESASEFCPDICLSQENIESFRAFQASVMALRGKSHGVSARKVSFAGKDETRRSSGDIHCETSQWKPMPDDILGYLLPAFMVLMDNKDALEVMLQNDIFQTIASFLKTSLSHLLENKLSSYPEGTTLNALEVVEQVYTNSPASAAQLECFQELFEISLLALPNLLSLPAPPPLVCLKLLEVYLSAYRLQMRDHKRKSSLPWLKHSQSRLFKAALDYLSSFYGLKQQTGGTLQLFTAANIWRQAEDSWSGCIAGLCTLVRSVEELQDVLAKSHILPDFLSFLAQLDGFDDCSESAQRVIQSLVSLTETAAEGSEVLLKLICQNQGQIIARSSYLLDLQARLSELNGQLSGYRLIVEYQETSEETDWQRRVLQMSNQMCQLRANRR